MVQGSDKWKEFPSSKTSVELGSLITSNIFDVSVLGLGSKRRATGAVIVEAPEITWPAPTNCPTLGAGRMGQRQNDTKSVYLHRLKDTQ